MSEFFSSKKKKFIFIHIPKTGGTSVKKIISDKIKIEGFNISNQLVTYTKKTHIKMNKKTFLKYKDYFKFVFVRQYGLMIGIEFVFSNNPKKVMDIVNKLRENNILVLLCGNKNQYIRLLPPLNINEREIYIFIDKLSKIIN